ncbi:hypothetical protein [Desulfocurvibacter africanus]|uniref:Uncharacterized protein n=1 Tax=Desulfocurvibacter africanus subsp. africanus str. Walvis Bay TaxID=690850 RepID=F3YY18_DESAF|nr:hypothetical protein [Desulfocurvibacter africanus]EGJ51794.1 hypothetical protein Desaf_3510 [Desulfocurvibacter africanus subsp. africanus str. Walvis Bay]
MTKVILHEDLIVRRLPLRSEAGLEVGELPAGVGLERLRYDGERIVDLAELASMHVRCEGGAFTLHAVAVPGSQPVAMTYADRGRLAMEPDGRIRAFSPEEWAQREEARQAKAELAASDKRMARVSEDLAAVLEGLLDDLKAAGVLTAEQAESRRLPQAVKSKVAARQALRAKL